MVDKNQHNSKSTHVKAFEHIKIVAMVMLQVCLGSLEGNPIQVNGPEPGAEDPDNLRSYLQVSRAHHQQHSEVTSFWSLQACSPTGKNPITYCEPARMSISAKRRQA